MVATCALAKSCESHACVPQLAGCTLNWCFREVAMEMFPRFLRPAPLSTIAAWCCDPIWRCQCPLDASDKMASPAHKLLCQARTACCRSLETCCHAALCPPRPPPGQLEVRAFAESLAGLAGRGQLLGQLLYGAVCVRLGAGNSVQVCLCLDL